MKSLSPIVFGMLVLGCSADSKEGIPEMSLAQKDDFMKARDWKPERTAF